MFEPRDRKTYAGAANNIGQHYYVRKFSADLHVYPQYDLLDSIGLAWQLTVDLWHRSPYNEALDKRWSRSQVEPMSLEKESDDV
jgi:hypothetical protein